METTIMGSIIYIYKQCQLCCGGPLELDHSHQHQQHQQHKKQRHKKNISPSAMRAFFLRAVRPGCEIF